MSNTFSSVELFAGGGGMALGSRHAGFDHLALVEWNPSAAKILRYNSMLRPSLWHVDRVFQQDVRAWLDETSIEPGAVDLLAGGPPCQPFSLAGVHAGDMDDRNMFPAAIAAVRKFQPKLVLFENVPGLTRPSFAPYFQYIKDQLAKPTVIAKAGEFWSDHHERIRQARPWKLRYRVHELLVEAADFGLPQSRRRVILVGVRSDVPGGDAWTPPAPTHSRDALLYDQWVSGDYWTEHGVPMPERPEGIEARIRLLKDAGRPDFVRWQTIRDCLQGLPAPVDREPSVHVSNHEGIPGARVYAKHSGSRFDWPAKTIKAGVHGVSGGEAMIHFDDGSLRYFTVRESARMQGFDDEYEFPVARSRSMGAIGNAVAVPVAETLTRSLRRLLDAMAADVAESQLLPMVPTPTSCSGEDGLVAPVLAGVARS